jgi:hypothetical protein
VCVCEWVCYVENNPDESCFSTAKLFQEERRKEEKMCPLIWVVSVEDHFVGFYISVFSFLVCLVL